MRDVIAASDELIASAGYLADRISVNLEQENKIFEEHGVEAYEAYQVAHENEILQKGAAFGAHIFFDDQDIHTEPASAVVPADTVPYRDGDNPKE